VPRTTVVIIGAGQAGLAMSHCLSEVGIDHVVLERGAIAQRWRTHGWDSLRLLTPNWMTRLPGFQYDGPDPHGFMTTGELVTMLERYATLSRTPIVTEAEVRRVERWRDGLEDQYRVATTRGTWCASAVVIATGHSDRPAIPAMSAALPPWIQQLAPENYRNPEQLAPEGVLIVGASSTGVQLADEIQRSGRQVILAVGRHTRLPRSYRGHDILWWLDQLGVLAQEAATVHDLTVSRAQPSLQLVGRPDHVSLNLADLRTRGVRLAGRVVEMTSRRVSFSDDLVSTMAAADVKLATVLMRIDDFTRRTGVAADGAVPFEPTWSLEYNAPRNIDLRAERIRTVIWATGYRRGYPWLRVPVLDGHGEVRHQYGVTATPGLYVLGLHFQRRRNSSFIDGVGSDACHLADHIAASLQRKQIA
jgi:putative flavoprotein involved in K+ transport